MNENPPIETIDESQIPEPHGIGGWLGFFVFTHCLGLVVNVIASFVILANSYASDITLYALCYIAFETILFITFCRRYIAFRVVFLVGNIVLLAFAYFITPDKNYALSQLISRGIGLGLYTLYFFLSKRVANTFHDLKGAYHYKPKDRVKPKAQARSTPTSQINASPALAPHAAPAVKELRTIHPRPSTIAVNKAENPYAQPSEPPRSVSESRRGTRSNARTVPLKWVVIAGAVLTLLIATPFTVIAIQQNEQIVALSQEVSRSEEQLQTLTELLNESSISEKASSEKENDEFTIYQAARMIEDKTNPRVRAMCQGRIHEDAYQDWLDFRNAAYSDEGFQFFESYVWLDLWFANYFDYLVVDLNDSYMLELCDLDLNEAYEIWADRYDLDTYNSDYFNYFSYFWNYVNDN